MATATIVQTWKSADGQTAYAAAVVPEGGRRGNVEYIAQAPANDAAGDPKGAAQLRADLAAALAAVRNQQVGVPGAVAGVTGTVTV